MPIPRPPAPEICPVCGEDVPRNALACRQCGADHQSGWREDAHVYDGADVPDDAFDYDDFIRQEFSDAGAHRPRRRSGFSTRPHGLHPVWWITAGLLFLAFAFMYLRPLFS